MYVCVRERLFTWFADSYRCAACSCLHALKRRVCIRVHSGFVFVFLTTLVPCGSAAGRRRLRNNKMTCMQVLQERGIVHMEAEQSQATRNCDVSSKESRAGREALAYNGKCKDHDTRESEGLCQTGTTDDASDDAKLHGTWMDVDTRWPMGVRMSLSGETRVLMAEETKSLPGIDGAVDLTRSSDGGLCRLLPRLAPAVDAQGLHAKFLHKDASPSLIASSGAVIAQPIGFQRCKEASGMVHVHTMLPCVQTHRKSPSKHAIKGINSMLARDFGKVMRSTGISMEKNGIAQVPVVRLPHTRSLLRV